jgi:hypothetical protein
MVWAGGPPPREGLDSLLKARVVEVIMTRAAGPAPVERPRAASVSWQGAEDMLSWEGAASR